MIDCPHCGRALEIAIRAGTCPHCNGNLVNESDKKHQQQDSPVPTGTLDLSQYQNLLPDGDDESGDQDGGNGDSARSPIQAPAEQSDQTSGIEGPTSGNGPGSGNGASGSDDDSGATPVKKVTPLATMVPEMHQEPPPSSIPTVMGDSPADSTVSKPADTSQGDKDRFSKTQTISPDDLRSASEMADSNKDESNETPQSDPAFFAGGTIVRPLDDPMPGGTESPSDQAGGAQDFGNQTQLTPGTPPPPTGAGANPFEHGIPTVRGSQMHQSDPVGSGGPPSDSGKGSGVKQLWEAFADSRVGPMASIKSDDMSVGRDDGLVIHRRQLVPADAPQADEADYKVVRYLGQGAMGVVFEANQTAMQRDVAVKTLRPELARKANDRQKFLYEASITGELDHPNIVPIHDVGVSHDGTLFYSMKRVDGTPWQNVMHTKSRAENLEILMKVADAISFAHSRDVIHRDLKPENVMLGQFGEVLVMDWGLAINLTKGKDFVLGGTPAYMAPEMARHQVELIDKVSDIYLLGAMLFQIIAGLPPHPGETVTQCVSAAARNVIIPVEKKDELLSIALCAMELSPDARYQTVTDFQDAIRDYQDHAESIQMADRAEADLEHAIAHNDYQAYSRARFGFMDAVKLWSGNQAAKNGAQRAKIAHATEALNNEDFDLGLQLLDAKNPEDAPLFSQLKRGLKERRSRLRRIKTARWMAMTFLATAVVITVVAAFFLYQQNLSVIEARDKAIAEQEEADRQRSRADTARGEAEANLIAANEAKAEAEINLIAANEAQAEAETNLIAANEAKAEAETNLIAANEAKAEAETNLIAANEAKAEAETNLIAAQMAQAAEAAERRKTQQALFNLNESQYAILLGKLKSDLTLARNDIVNDKINEAIANLDDLMLNRIEDEQFPLSFKGWELYRLYQLAHARLPATEIDTGLPISTAASTTGGELFAVGNDDGSILIYSRESNQPIQSMQLPDALGTRISSLGFDASGTQLVVGVREAGIANVSTWDVHLGQQIGAAWTAHDDGVRDVHFADDGLTLITAGLDRRDPFESIKRWERSSPSDAFEMVAGGRCGFSPIDQVDVSGDGNRIIALTTAFHKFSEHGEEQYRRIVGLFEDNRFESSYLALPYEEGNVECIAFDPSDPSGNTIFVGTSDGVVLRWTIEEITQPTTGPNRDKVAKLAVQRFFGHDPNRPVTAISASLVNDATRTDSAQLQLISASGDGRIILWDTERRNPDKTLYGHQDLIEVCGLTADGAAIYSGCRDQFLRFWNVADLDAERRLSPYRYDGSATPDIVSLDFDESNRWIAGGDRFGRISLWEPRGGDLIASVRVGHELSQSMRVVYRAGTGLMISVSNDGTTRIWDPSDGSQVAQWSDSTTLNLFNVSNNGLWIVMGVNDPRRGASLRVVDLENVQYPKIFPLTDISAEHFDGSPGSASGIDGVAISDDGTKLFLSRNRHLLCFDPEKGALVESRVRPGSNGSALAFLQGDQFVMAQERHGVELFDGAGDLTLTSRKIRLHQSLTTRVEDVETFDGRTLVVVVAHPTQQLGSDGGAVEANDDDQRILVFDATEWANLEPQDTAHVVDPIVDTLFDGGMIVSASLANNGEDVLFITETNEIHAIDIESQNDALSDVWTTAAARLLEQTGSEYEIESLSVDQIEIASSGQVVLSGAGFATVFSSDASQEAFRIQPARSILSIDVVPGQDRVVATHGDGYVRVWDLLGAEDTGYRLVAETPFLGDYRFAISSPDAQSLLLVDQDGSANIVSMDPNDASIRVPVDAGKPIVSAEWTQSVDGGLWLLAGLTDGDAALWKWDGTSLSAHPIDLPTLNGDISSVAISPDMRYFAIGDVNGAVVLVPNPEKWEIHSGPLTVLAETRVGGADQTVVRGLEFNSTSDRLLVTRGTLSSLWHLDNESADLVESIYQLEHGHTVNDATFSSDGRLIASAAVDEGEIIVWLTSNWDLRPEGISIEESRRDEREALAAIGTTTDVVEPDSDDTENESDGE